MTSQLATIPPPGLAILPQYLNSNTLKVTLKGAFFGDSMKATITGNGQPLFDIDAESFSMSHRRTVIDATTKTKLFQIRKDGFGASRHYAEISEDGPRLFETDTHVRLLHRPVTTVTFANQADTSRPTVDLEFIPAMSTKDGSFSLDGQMVVLVEKVSLTTSGEYCLTIAPGLDPALIVGVMVAMIDRAESQSNHASAGAVAASIS